MKSFENLEFYRLKHDAFSLIFKVRSSLEILKDYESELGEIALDSILRLEKLLDRLFLADRVLRHAYSLKREAFNPAQVVAQVLKSTAPPPELEVEADPFLFLKATESVNYPAT
jgi:hypothetical protein